MKKTILISILTLVIDIISKQIVLNSMFEHQSISIIKNFFSITFTKNTGVAFSFLEGQIPLVVIITSIIIILILKYIKTNKLDKYETICYGLIIGGAIGNLIDRVIYGYVIDFFDFNLLSYSFPIFNIADIAIVVGVFILFILSIIESRNQNETNRRRKNKN